MRRVVLWSLLVGFGTPLAAELPGIRRYIRMVRM
jgi:hypothetical protein